LLSSVRHGNSLYFNVESDRRKTKTKKSERNNRITLNRRSNPEKQRLHSTACAELPRYQWRDRCTACITERHSRFCSLQTVSSL